MRHSHILTECRSHTLTPPCCILRAVLYQTVELELQCSTFSQSCDSVFAQCVQARVRLRRRRRPGKVRRWDSPSPDCHLSSEELQHCSRRKSTGSSWCPHSREVISLDQHDLTYLCLGEAWFQKTLTMVGRNVFFTQVWTARLFRANLKWCKIRIL